MSHPYSVPEYPTAMDSLLAGNDIDIDVFVSQKIGTLTVDKYGMHPVEAMLSVVGGHARYLNEGERGEYHAFLPDGPITVVVARDSVS